MTILLRLSVVLAAFFGFVATANADPSLTLGKADYSPYENVVVGYAGLPGIGSEFVAVAEADDTDDMTPNSFFTYGHEQGTFDFGRLKPGRYEARLYFASDYVVQVRVPFTVGGGAAASGQTTASSGTTAEAPPAESPATSAPTVEPVRAEIAGAPPAGYYECYIFGTYGLQNSSLTSMSVIGPGGYEALGAAGSFVFEAASNTLTLEDGPLAGSIAHMEESDGKPAIVFLRDENEQGGEPTIDISDTWCYYEPR